MYRNLNHDHASISGRLSELVEAALTFGFRGLDVDLVELARRVTDETLEGTIQIFSSAKINVGGFVLPLDLRAEEGEFAKQLESCQRLLELAGKIGARYAIVNIEPNTTLPFPEDFELHSKRLSTLGEKCGEHHLRLGIQLLASASHRAAAETPFIHQVDSLLTLLDAVKQEQVGLVLDSWDWTVGGGTVDQVRQLPVERIVAVRLGDLPTGLDHKVATESDRLMPGDGELDLAEWVRVLAEKQYEGPVATRTSPKHLEGLTRDACLKKAQNALNLLWEDAGLSPRTPRPEDNVEAESAESPESPEASEEQASQEGDEVAASK